MLAYVHSPRTKESDVGLETFLRIMQLKLQWGNLFKPNMARPTDLTPLHIAVNMKGVEDMVDALISDPCQVLQCDPNDPNCVPMSYITGFN
jgi:hypothetical protein